ncbi:MAG TPA: FUSC family protein [Jiangellales bacterium]|nr:FUSC family protein [Jiangellales bacterium]
MSPRERPALGLPVLGEGALELIGRRSQDTLRTRRRRLRLTAFPILQCAVGAGLAWAIATSPVFGHDQPFFAPIAAIIALGVSLGQRLRRVVELVVGVVVGVLVGDLLIGVIGTGVVQLVLVVALAMGGAVFLGGGAVIVSQAGSSAVLVATLMPPGPGELVDLTRPVDAAIGGVVGLAVSVLLLPVNPVVSARRHVDPVLRTVSEALRGTAEALEDRDRSAAALVLAQARGMQADVDAMHDALDASSEISLLAPVRWRARGQLAGYLDAAEPLDHAVRDLRVLARHVVALLRRKEPVPRLLPRALHELAGSAMLLRADLSRGDEPVAARRSAVQAARLATEALDETGGFAGQVVVAQTRSLAVDLMRATGIDRDEALRLLPGLPEGPVRYDGS